MVSAAFMVSKCIDTSMTDVNLLGALRGAYNAVSVIREYHC
jgi:hypothetical protein